MSSVLDTIKRVFGRERGHRPDPGAGSEAALPTQTGDAEPAMPLAATEPTLAMPGEEAELPVQSTAPPPIMTTPPAWTETPIAAGAVTESTREGSEAEPVAEPTSAQSDAAAQSLGQEGAQGLPTPVGLVEETAQHGVVEEPLAAASGQATVIEETADAIVVEEPVAELEGQEQAVEDEPLAPAPSPASPEPLDSAPAALLTQLEESPERQTVVESPEQDETQ